MALPEFRPLLAAPGGERLASWTHALVSVCGPHYRIRTPELSLVPHRAFGSAAQARKLRQTMEQTKRSTSTRILPLYQPVLITADPARATDVAYCQRVIADTFARCAAEHAADRTRAATLPDRWATHHAEQAAKLAASSSTSSSSSSSASASSSSSSSSSASASSSSSSSSSASASTSTSASSEASVETKKSASETEADAPAINLPRPVTAKGDGADRKGASEVPADKEQEVAGPTSGQEADEDALFAVPPQFADRKQRAALVHVVDVPNSADVIVVLAGFFASPKDMGAYARHHVDRYRGHRWMPDCVRFDTDRRRELRYSRALVDRMCFPARGLKRPDDNIIQVHYDMLRANRHELAARDARKAATQRAPVSTTPAPVSATLPGPTSVASSSPAVPLAPAENASALSSLSHSASRPVDTLTEPDG